MVVAINLSISICTILDGKWEAGFHLIGLDAGAGKARQKRGGAIPG
jgi:hypothetical protein